MNENEPPPGPTPQEEDEMRRRLASLKVEHRDVDAAVEALAAQPRPDMLQVARLKKKKLHLRDEIARIEDVILPDIIA